MDNLEAVARSLGGLIAVLALVWVVARVLRGRPGTVRGGGIRVTHRIGLARRSGVAVVEAGERRILVGVGDAQVTFLADLGPAVMADADVPADAAPGVVASGVVASGVVAPGVVAPAAGAVPRPPRRQSSVSVRELPDVSVPPQRGQGLRQLVMRAQERTVRR